MAERSCSICLFISCRSTMLISGTLSIIGVFSIVESVVAAWDAPIFPSSRRASFWLSFNSTLKSLTDLSFMVAVKGAAPVIGISSSGWFFSCSSSDFRSSDCPSSGISSLYCIRMLITGSSIGACELCAGIFGSSLGCSFSCSVLSFEVASSSPDEYCARIDITISASV